MTTAKKWLDISITFLLCLLIFSLPFSKSIVEASFAIAFALWALKIVLSYFDNSLSVNLSKFSMSTLDIALALFVLANMLSVVTSHSIPLSVKGFLSKLLQEVVLYFMVAKIINDKKRLKAVLITMFLSMLLISADGIFQLARGVDFLRHHEIYNAKVRASFNNPNGFGGWLIAMVPIAVCILWTKVGFWSKMATKIVIFIILFMMATCVVFTCSRSTWLAVILGLFSIAILKRNIFIILPVIVAITLPFIAPDFVKDRFLLMFPNLAPYSIKARICSFLVFTDPVRLSLWHEALKIIKDFPLFGCGLNTYSIVAPRYKGAGLEAGIYPHNSYLQMAAETGIFGLMSFIIVILALFTLSFISMRKIKDSLYKNVLIGLLVGLFGLLVQSFFDVDFYALQLNNLIWFIMGLTTSVRYIALKEKSE